MFWKRYYGLFDVENVGLNKLIQKFVNENDSKEVDPCSSIGILLALISNDYSSLVSKISYKNKILSTKILELNKNEKHIEIK